MGNLVTAGVVFQSEAQERAGAMVLQLKGSAKIKNLTTYPAETVEKVRALLAAGAVAYPDPRRKGFYEVQNGSRVFYVHLTPRGDVWFLASWLKSASLGS